MKSKRCLSSYLGLPNNTLKDKSAPFEFNRVFAFPVHSLQRQHIIVSVNSNRSIPIWNNLSASNITLGPRVVFLGLLYQKKDSLNASLLILSIAELLVCHQRYIGWQITFAFIYFLYISVRLLPYFRLSLIYSSYG